MDSFISCNWTQKKTLWFINYKNIKLWLKQLILQSREEGGGFKEPSTTNKATDDDNEL